MKPINFDAGVNTLPLLRKIRSGIITELYLSTESFQETKRDITVIQ